MTPTAKSLERAKAIVDNHQAKYSNEVRWANLALEIAAALDESQPHASNDKMLQTTIANLHEHIRILDSNQSILVEALRIYALHQEEFRYDMGETAQEALKKVGIE